MGTLTGDPAWDGFTYGVAALLGYTTYDLVLSFVGRREESRGWRRLVTAYFVAMAMLE